MGKGTIDTTTHGLNKGKNGSYSDNYQQTGRELLTADEVRMLDNRYALLFVRGERPMVDEKFNLLRHPNIAATPDAGGSPFAHDGLDFLQNDTIFEYEREKDFEILDGDELAEIILTYADRCELEIEPIDNYEFESEEEAYENKLS